MSGPAPIAVRLVQGPVAAEWARAAVAGADAGCVVLFLGTVRATSRGREVTALEYQAYPRMVETELGRIAAEIGAIHPVLRFAVEHAVGRVEVGACSVAVAVASAHRAAAFAAAAAFLDALKERVPIWKRETYTDGSAWIGRGS